MRRRRDLMSKSKRVTTVTWFGVDERLPNDERSVLVAVAAELKRQLTKEAG
jgi:hypothetical protein